MKTFRQNSVNTFPRKHPLASSIFLIFSKNLQFRRHFVSVSRSTLGRLVPSPPREPRETEWSRKFWRWVRDETLSFPDCQRTFSVLQNDLVLRVGQGSSGSIHFVIYFKTTGHNIKWDHFDILAKGKTDYHCKVKETLFIQELEPAFNATVGSQKLMLH